nr:reverse transcriptase domain-containing protein [Tanacetum cinerariifolium]
LEKLKRQEKEADDAAETLRKTFAKSTEDLLLQAGAARYSSIKQERLNTDSTPINTASTPVNTTSPSRNVNTVGPSYLDLLNYANQGDSHISSLEDIYEVPNDGIFTSTSYDDEGAVADFTNLESTVNIEPKKIFQALEDESWVDVIQEELLQFKTQQFVNSNSASTSSSGTLPSNTIANPKSDLKAITTRSGVSYDGPQILPSTSFLPKVVEDEPEATKCTVNPTNNESTEDVLPQVVQSESTSELVTSPISEPVIALVTASKPNPKTSIPYPSRRNDERNHEKANNQIEKFYQIF